MKKNSRKKNNNIHYKLPESAIGFLNYLETIKNKSRNTINGYRVDLTTFFRFMMIHRKRVSNNIEFEDIDISGIDNEFIRSITLSDMYSFLNFCQIERDNGAYSRARKVYCLRSYFKYLHKKAKIINENIAEELEKPDIPVRKPIYLDIDKSNHLLKSLDIKSRNYWRDKCILTLFLNCGFRLSELCSLKFSMIQDDVITLIGKGSKERLAFLNEDCLKAMREYLVVRDDDNAPEEEKEYLFLSERKQRISKRTVEVLVTKHIRNANLNDANYHTHTLRASFCTNLYKQGVKIRELQELMAHKNMTTTQRYIGVDEKSLRDAVRKIY